MRERIAAVVIVGLLSVLVPASSLLSQAAAPSPNLPADQAVAARVSGLAQQLLRQQQLSRPVFEQAAVLFAMAAKLDSAEARYWRLLAEAEVEAGNREGAIAALNALEAVDPRDTIPAAWVQMIDLYLQGMQQVPDQLQYLEDIYNQQRIPSSIRSHAALRAAELRASQAAPGLAQQWVERALELNPVNPLAARLNWSLVGDSEDRGVRVKALLRLVQADPASLPNVATLADQLARAGFYDAALTWYAMAIQLAQRSGVSDPAMIFDYAAELFIGNDALSAGNLVTQLLQADPRNVDALFLRLLLDRDKPRDMRDEALGSAQQALLDRLAEVRKAGNITPGPGALDLSADLQMLGGDNVDPELQAAYASAVADLAWFELYFKGPGEQTDRLLAFLRSMAPADSATLARLEGWNFLLRNRPDEARVKLEAAAGRDPLAKLGLLRMVDRADDRAMEAMTAEGQALLSEHPAGLIGAFLAGELRQFGVRVQPHPSAADLADEVRAFSRDWPQAYTNPGVFYNVRVQPLKVSHQIGEPILAQVEIQNNSTLYALSVDNQGAIRPDLWFDVRIQGAIQQNQAGVAYDRLMQNIVLAPRQTLSQIVRLDRGALGPMLDANPQIAFPMTFALITNPQTVQAQDGSAVVVAGLLGQSVPFARIVNREAGQPTPATLNNMITNLQAGLPEKKIEAIDYIRAWVPALREQLAAAETTPEQKQQIQPLLGQLLFQLSRARQDSIPAVRAWAAFTTALVAEADQQAETLRQMRAGGSPAEMLLSLLAAQQLDPALAADVAGRLKDDADPLVRRLAAATLEVAATAAAATQPDKPGEPAPNK